VTTPDTHATVQTIFRLEWPRLVAGLVRLVRDVGLAEELAQDALVVALTQWPESGIPDSPGAWLQATARNRAINALRRGALATRKLDQLGVIEAEREQIVPDLGGRIDDDVGDDMLRLILIACDPVLPVEARVALTLRLLGGLTTEEIARAFLVSEPTISQRIVRAKRALAEAQRPFEVPQGEDLAQRLSSVFGVIYLIYNEGYTATKGEDLIRPRLCEDALRLGRMLAELVPHEPEAHGLIALMELQASRSAARVDDAGEPVLLLEQDRARWDPLLIQRGLAALARAEALGSSHERGEARDPARGRYTLQAAIAACHARARAPLDTDWSRIADLYGELAAVTPSPVIQLNRAMAVSMASGPAAGLALIDALVSEPSLRSYHLLPSARADLLAKLGRLDEARAEFERAASLTENARQKAKLRERAKACLRDEPEKNSQGDRD
jgi:RNA polymerase sigma-70 factor (ECF subfamily)